MSTTPEPLSEERLSAIEQHVKSERTHNYRSVVAENMLRAAEDLLAEVRRLREENTRLWDERESYLKQVGTQNDLLLERARQAEELLAQIERLKAEPAVRGWAEALKENERLNCEVERLNSLKSEWAEHRESLMERLEQLRKERREAVDLLIRQRDAEVAKARKAEEDLADARATLEAIKAQEESPLAAARRDVLEAAKEFVEARQERVRPLADGHAANLELAVDALRKLEDLEHADKEVKVSKVEFPDKIGCISLELRNPIFAVIASEMAKVFRKGGGVNHVEWHLRAEDPAVGDFSLLMQRRAGKTPAQINAELRAEIERLRARLVDSRQAFAESSTDRERRLGIHVDALKKALYAECRGLACGENCAGGHYNCCDGCESRAKAAHGPGWGGPPVTRQAVCPSKSEGDELPCQLPSPHEGMDHRHVNDVVDAQWRDVPAERRPCCSLPSDHAGPCKPSCPDLLHGIICDCPKTEERA